MGHSNIAIFGIGNILLSDDGVGIHAVHKLKDEYTFPESVELIDGGTKGLDLLPLLEGRDKVLIIDAVNFKEAPGTIGAVAGENIPAVLRSKLSVHQIGLPDMLFAARLMKITPPEMCLIGIQPKSMETGTELSDEIKERLDALVKKVLLKLREWGVEPDQSPSPRAETGNGPAGPTFPRPGSHKEANCREDLKDRREKGNKFL
ncbi:MAG: HyaD/HybD family hydrogenase maturation endopeptidase [Nitrospiraceae bacterium]|nr:MAG: HyaD/HybD family hydrogenase maturation endopeptidase [Nitrospiraceae bacterium]